ncbi:MAG: hypothetical protein ACFFE2_13185 [Candidatus Thorarchaeota archaeon]
MDSTIRYLGYVRYLVFVVLISMVLFYSGAYLLRGDVLSTVSTIAGLVLVLISLLNLLIAHLRRDRYSFSYTLLLFVAMVLILVSTLVMEGIFYITPDAFLNSIFFAGTGLVFYILSLRSISPLLIRPDIGESTEESSAPGLIVRNLLLLILCIAVVAVLYYFTAFNPFDLTVSSAALLCAMILASAVAFSISKCFNNFPTLFKLFLVGGFLMTMYSSWVLAVIQIASSDFFSSFVVGITFIIGQFLIHLSPIVGIEP